MKYQKRIEEFKNNKLNTVLEFEEYATIKTRDSKDLRRIQSIRTLTKEGVLRVWNVRTGLPVCECKVSLD